jgi:type 1 fimbria pilin
MKHITRLNLTLLALGLPITAQAACNVYPNIANSVTFPTTITVPTSHPVGGRISSQSFGGPFPIVNMNCPTSTLRQNTGRFTTLVPLPGVDGVYQTNVPGIGMRVLSYTTWGGPFPVMLSNSSYTMPPGAHVYNVTGLMAEFYKTGPVTTGTLPSGSLYDERWAVNQGRVQMLLNTSIRFVDPTATCDLDAGDVNRTIALPPVQVSAFNDAVSAGTRDFELTAHCSNASSVTFRFTGNPATGNTALFENTGSAGGVGLWLYARVSGSRQTISPNDSRTQAVSGNRAILLLGAGYYKNGTVSQGTLASIATVNITYN